MGQTIFLISAILFSIAFIALLRGSFGKLKSISIKKIGDWMVFVGFGYFILAMLSFFWFFEVLPFFYEDLIVVYAIVILIQNLIFFFLFFSILKTKAFIALGLVYLLSITASLFLLNDYFIALFFTFIFSLIFFCFIRKVSGTASDYGIIYSGVSIILITICLLGNRNIFLFSLISTLFFIIFVIAFTREIKEFVIYSKNDKKEASYFSTLFQAFVFVLTFTGLVFLGVIMAHEFSHILIADFFDCDSRAIFYEDWKAPYSEVFCTNPNGNFFAALAGFLIPFVILLFLFFTGGNIIKEMAVIGLGFALFISYEDLIFLGLSQGLALAIVFLGILLMSFGVILLVQERVRNLSSS